MILATALLATVLGGRITLQDDLPCPSALQIELAMGRLAFAPQQSDHAVLVEEAERGLRVRLLDGSGEVLAEKVLAPKPDCEGLAKEVAVMVSVWEAGFQSSLAPPLLEAPSVDPTPIPTPVTVAAAPLPQPPPHARLHLGVAAGVLGSWTDVGLAAGGDLGVSARFRRFSVELEAQAVSERSIAVGQGQLQWMRATLVVGAGYAILDGQIRLEALPQVAGALLFLQSSGLTPPVAMAEPDFGWGGAVRASLRMRLRPWVQVSALIWPIEREAALPVVNESNSLPSLELFLATGVSFEAD